MVILDKFPNIDEFYATYWGRKPFLVRNAIAEQAFDEFIDGDTLAGLSLEEHVKSRIVMTSAEGNEWTCEHGPFDEDHFSTLGETNWSLLVQNVEQYHTDTANLLRAFNFTPRWLLDDIMVSYSAAGGTVGPHTDSYHVFLVQGMGKRSWTVGNNPVENEQCIEGLDLKVLQDGVDGETVEVSIGDVIYIPPNFAHDGKTLETAMTFSVGFLGPQLSELFIEYGHYLEQVESQNKRYVGAGLDAKSAGFKIENNVRDAMQDDLVSALRADEFSVWLAEYFSTPSDIDMVQNQEKPLSSKELIEKLRAGEVLHKPEYIKYSIIALSDGQLVLSVYGDVVTTMMVHNLLIERLNKNVTLSIQDIEALGHEDEMMNVIEELYNKSVLFFEE